MCIDDPGRVIAIDELGAIVETPSHHRRASTLLLPDVAVGDWVTVASGTIVERLTPEEAAEIREILDRAADPLRSSSSPRVPVATAASQAAGMPQGPKPDAPAIEYRGRS